MPAFTQKRNAKIEQICQQIRNGNYTNDLDKAYWMKTCQLYDTLDGNKVSGEIFPIPTATSGMKLSELEPPKEKPSIQQLWAAEARYGQSNIPGYFSSPGIHPYNWHVSEPSSTIGDASEILHRPTALNANRNPNLRSHDWTDKYLAPIGGKIYTKDALAPMYEYDTKKYQIFDDSNWQEQYKTRRKTGIIVNPYLGETYNVYEENMPPPQTARNVVAPGQLRRINPKLISLQGGYNNHMPPPRKREICSRNPGPDAGRNPWGDALVADRRRQEMIQRSLRTTLMNRNGEYPVQPYLDRKPNGYVGYVPAYRNIPYNPPTQRGRIPITRMGDPNLTNFNGPERSQINYSLDPNRVSKNPCRNSKYTNAKGPAFRDSAFPVSGEVDEMIPLNMDLETYYTQLNTGIDSGIIQGEIDESIPLNIDLETYYTQLNSGMDAGNIRTDYDDLASMKTENDITYQQLDTGLNSYQERPDFDATNKHGTEHAGIIGQVGEGIAPIQLSETDNLGVDITTNNFYVPGVDWDVDAVNNSLEHQQKDVKTVKIGNPERQNPVEIDSSVRLQKILKDTVNKYLQNQSAYSQINPVTSVLNNTKVPNKFTKKDYSINNKKPTGPLNGPLAALLEEQMRTWKNNRGKVPFYHPNLSKTLDGQDSAYRFPTCDNRGTKKQEILNRRTGNDTYNFQTRNGCKDKKAKSVLNTGNMQRVSVSNMPGYGLQ